MTQNHQLLIDGETRLYNLREGIFELLLMPQVYRPEAEKRFEEVLKDILILTQDDYEEVAMPGVIAYINAYLMQEYDRDDFAEAVLKLKRKERL